MEVRFEHLNIKADVYVGTRGLPTVLNAYRNFVEVGSGILSSIARGSSPRAVCNEAKLLRVAHICICIFTHILTCAAPSSTANMTATSLSTGVAGEAATAQVREAQVHRPG